jgi:hypothetical protein
VPLPPVGSLEPHSGLKRGKINQLILPCAENGWKPPVRSISLRPRNCIRGKRLIHLPSLLAYLRAQLPDGGGNGAIVKKGRRTAEKRKSGLPTEKKGKR